MNAARVTTLAIFLMSAADAATAQTTALRFGRVWDGTRLIRDAVVLVDGQRITRIAEATEPLPDKAEVVDLRRYTALPGLIDLHTHITYYWDRRPGTRPLGQRRRPAVTVFLAQENARRTLETGVTTARDLGASNDTDFAMRDLIDIGAMQGPRLIVAGQGISAPRPSSAQQLPASPGADALRAATMERIKAGSDWIKVYASRGSFDSVDTTADADVRRDEGDRGHGARAGQESRHPFVWPVGREGCRQGRRGFRLSTASIWMMRRSPRWRSAAPSGCRPSITIATTSTRRTSSGSSRRPCRRSRTTFSATSSPLGAPSRPVSGSEWVPDAVFSMFGQNTRELGWFVKAGMTPAQALATATTTAADLLGMQDRLGRLAPGYLADVVAVEGNPLDDIDVLFTGIRWVMKDGKPWSTSGSSG